MKKSKSIPKSLIKQWQEHTKWIMESSPDPEAEEEKKIRIKKSIDDYQYFVSTYFGHYTKDINGNEIPLAYFHKEAAYYIRDTEPTCKYAAQWARSHSKSTNISLFIPIWLMLQGKMHNLLLISKSKDDATTLLQHIQAEFEYNDLLINDYAIDGSFKEEGDWTKGRFSVKGYNCCFSAIGRGNSPRGMRYKNYRVDYVIADDIDDDELCRSEKRVKETWNWFVESVMNTAEQTRYRIIMVENLYSNNSLMFNFMKMKNVKVSKVNMLKQNGEPSWPERFSKEVAADIKSRGTISFLREYQNTPITEGSVFDPDWFLFKEMVIHQDNYEFVCIYFDPAWTSTSKSDYKGIAVVSKKGNDYHVLDFFLRKSSINTAVGWIYDVYDEYEKQGVIPYLYMESNFAQQLIWDELQTVSDERGYDLPITFDDRQKGNKYARIESMSPYFERKMIYFNEDKKEESDFKRLFDQLSGFEPGANINDDGPDALQSSIWFVNKNTRNFEKTNILTTEEINNSY